MHSPLRVSAKEADKQARRFAQEFLLPAHAMTVEMQKPVTLSSLAALKTRWGVSISFLAKRAEALSLLTPNQYRYVIQQMRTAWGGRSEPGDESVIPERPRLLKKMSEMLYGNPIELPKLAKDSGLPVYFLRTILGLQTDMRVIELKPRE
jgi:Zn-dependent peptidase ImmA (M78 family)